MPMPSAARTTSTGNSKASTPRRLNHGWPNGMTTALEAITDLDWREVAIFAPLCAGTLILGVYPMSVFHITQASVDQMVSAYHAAIGG